MIVQSGAVSSVIVVVTAVAAPSIAVATPVAEPSADSPMVKSSGPSSRASSIADTVKVKLVSLTSEKVSVLSRRVIPVPTSPASTAVRKSP